MVGVAAYLVYGTSIKPPGSDGNVLSQLPAGAATYTALVLITSHVLVAFGLLLQPLLIQVEIALGLPSPYAQAPEGSPLADPKVGLEGEDDEDNINDKKSDENSAPGGGRSSAAASTSASSSSSSEPALRLSLSAPRLAIDSVLASSNIGGSERTMVSVAGRWREIR